MNIMISILLILLLFLNTSSFSQNEKDISWWNPAQNQFNVIDGQAWSDEVESNYDRLPERAKEKVRKAVWNLSRNSAGLKIRFRTNASEISVRYKVTGNLEMSHMPATGVSGVDLYAKDSDGKWLWCRGHWSFSDTVKYNFRNITPNDNYHKLGREYHLYLPLYNSVEWLEIGADNNALFEPIATRKEKPIVVYGTSIAQGGCASRPGMAWTSILERKMDRPLINLAFSGNGELESELIELISEIDARIFILDCLPNLIPGNEFTLEEIYNRILNSVRALQKKSVAPILLVEHSGYANSSSNKELFYKTNSLNHTMQKAFALLKSEGRKNIFLMSQKEIGLSLHSQVDGIHPTDLGMLEYAKAYEKKLRSIFNEPIGKISTTIPVTQAREPGMYNWEKRHNELLELNKKNPPKICYFGNSITHYWGEKPEEPQSNGSESWNKYLGDLDIQNFGFGWDRIENVLWRIYHDELEGFSAEQIILNLGTNNLHLNIDKEIVEGLDLVIQSIKSRQPHAKILVIGIYPRRDKEKRVAELNMQIAQLAGMQNVNFIDVGNVLLKDNGKINEKLFLDGLHPNEKGYSKLAPEIRLKLKID